MGLTAGALSQTARRFPLVARPRPAGQPLSARIAEVEQLAQAASGGGPAQHAEAHNKAALIASDCGLPGLARDLCWRQFAIYQRAAPLPAETAQLAMQPIVNLARLLIRDGDGGGAYTVLDSLYQAARTRSTAILDGHPVAFGELTRSAADHRALCHWLWTVVLADGIRALICAGRWNQALAHARHHRGIGTRLLDGRQIAALAHCLNGDHTTALEIVQQSTITEAWEKVVADSLTVLCLKSSRRPVAAATAIMVQDYLTLTFEPGLLTFRTHLGLAVMDLADRDSGTQAAKRLIHEAITARDSYAARDILGHDRCRAHITDAAKETRSAAVQAAGLGSGIIPAHQMARLQSATDISEATLARYLTPDRGLPQDGRKLINESPVLIPRGGAR